MKHRMKRSSTTLVLLASLLGGASWSTASYACSTEPYIGSVCIMAWAKTNSFGNGMYMPATGATLNVSNYQALYSVIGATYGGNGTSTFQLPDLRGKVLIGVGQNPDSGLIYNYGQKGGAPTVTLTTLNMPAHVHPLNAGTSKLVTTATTLGNMAASTTLTGLTASTSMSGVTATAAGSGLMLNGSTGGNFGTSPSNTSLGTYSSTTKIYSDATPTVAMKSGGISGTAPVTFSGNPTTTITGTPTTTLSGAPGVTVGGTTDPTGSGQAFSIMQPYLAMSYYIAVNGIYPSID